MGKFIMLLRLKINNLYMLLFLLFLMCSKQQDKRVQIDDCGVKYSPRFVTSINIEEIDSIYSTQYLNNGLFDKSTFSGYNRIKSKTFNSNTGKWLFLITDSLTLGQDIEISLEVEGRKHLNRFSDIQYGKVKVYHGWICVVTSYVYENQEFYHPDSDFDLK